jgi:hypothetical protein
MDIEVLLGLGWILYGLWDAWNWWSLTELWDLVGQVHSWNPGGLGGAWALGLMYLGLNNILLQDLDPRSMGLLGNLLWRTRHQFFLISVDNLLSGLIKGEIWFDVFGRQISECSYEFRTFSWSYKLGL